MYPRRIISILHTRSQLLVRLHLTKPLDLLRILRMHHRHDLVGVPLARPLVDPQRPRDVLPIRRHRRALPRPRREDMRDRRRKRPRVVERQAAPRGKRAPVGVRRVPREGHPPAAQDPRVEGARRRVGVHPRPGRRVDDRAVAGVPTLVEAAEHAWVAGRVPLRAPVRRVGGVGVALVGPHDREEAPPEPGHEEGPVGPPDVLGLVGEVGHVREVRGGEDGPEGHPAGPGRPGSRHEERPHPGVDAVCPEDDVGGCCGAVAEGDGLLVEGLVEGDRLECLV